MKAIVLSGGAAYGAYEVGVLKALSERTGFDPEIITGTSVGAYNAALLASDSIPRLEEIWREDIPDHGLGNNGVLRVRGNPLPYLAPVSPVSLFASALGDTAALTKSAIQRTSAFLTSHGNAASRMSELLDVSAFISCAPLRETISRTVCMSRIRESRKQLHIIATDWEAGVARVFRNEDMTDIDGESVILASTAIPGVFPAVMFRGTPHVDGGVVMNTPLKPAIDAGADELHVISLIPGIARVEPSELDNTLEAMLRVLQIHIGSIIREDAQTACWINAGIDAMESAAAGVEIDTQQLRDFVRVAKQFQKKAAEGLAFRRVTVHIYHPVSGLGSPLGLLDFSRSNIEGLIARGYEDGLNHTCESCGCITPKSAMPASA